MLRLTFRDKNPVVCYQKQCRDRFLHEGSPFAETPNLKTAQVRPVSRRLAEQIILKYEWLGTLPPSTRYYYGIFFHLYCAGVACIGLGNGGANLNAHQLFGVDRGSLAYLARGACVHWAPPGTNSKLVSWSCRFLRQSTTAKLMIAYADTDAGEIGTIYQACNWVYIGVGASTEQWVAPTGRVYDQKIIHDLTKRQGMTRDYWTKDLLQKGWRRQQSNPKHRYVIVLDKTDMFLYKRVERLRQPYPKRAVSIAVDAPAVQAGEDGAAPITALIH